MRKGLKGFVYRSPNLWTRLSDKLRITLNFRSQTVSLYQQSWRLKMTVLSGGLGSPSVSPDVCLARLEPCADHWLRSCPPRCLLKRAPGSRAWLRPSAVSPKPAWSPQRALQLPSSEDTHGTKGLNKGSFSGACGWQKSCQCGSGKMCCQGMKFIQMTTYSITVIPGK